MTGLLTSQRTGKSRRTWSGLLVSASLALGVVLVALETQSERVLDSEGLSWSLSALFGPAVFLGQSTQGWRVVVLGLFPALAARLGLAATAILGIGSLTGMVSAMGLIVQPNAPADAFRLLGFKRTPVVTVLAVIVVLVRVLSGKGSIHEVDRGSATGQIDGRRSTAVDVGRGLAGMVDRP